MKQITIDIETASDENIKDCGVYRYAESECFDLLLVSYAVDNGPVATCDIANGETLPDDVRNALTDKTVIKKAFHVNFERICLSVYLRRKYPEMLDFEDSTGSYLDPVSWQCDMIHCRYLGMLSSLDDMGRLLRLKEKKMAEGKELIRSSAHCTRKRMEVFYFMINRMLLRSGKNSRHTTGVMWKWN